MAGTDGRALHLLDVEYLGLGPQVTAGDLALVLDRYRGAVDWHLGDHLVGAASNFVYERIAWDCDDIRLLPAGGGPDAADRDSSPPSAPAPAHWSVMSDPRIAAELVTLDRSELSL